MNYRKSYGSSSLRMLVSVLEQIAKYVTNDVHVFKLCEKIQQLLKTAIK